MCLIKPSETPNTTCHFSNQLQVLLASRDIERGELLTVPDSPSAEA